MTENEHLKNEERDEEFLSIMASADEAIKKLVNSNIQTQEGLYQVGSFEVEIIKTSRMETDHTFKFWKKGKKIESSVVGMKFGSRGRALYVYTLKDTTELIMGDDGPLKIEKQINFMPNRYPQIEFQWTEDAQGIPRGALTCLRIDFSGSEFFSYTRDLNGEYGINNRTKKNIPDLGIPADLSTATEILGRPIEKNIDFDAEKKRILEASCLKELCQEINEAIA